MAFLGRSSWRGVVGRGGAALALAIAACAPPAGGDVGPGDTETDPDRAARIQVEWGLNWETAQLASLTTVAATPAGEDAHRISLALPGGGEIETTIRLVRDVTGAAPSDASAGGISPVRELQVSHALDGSEFSFHLEYLVPADVFPEGSLVARARSVAALGGAARLAAGETGDVRVIVDGVAKELTKEMISRMEDTLGHALDVVGLKGGNVSGATSSLLDVLDALGIGEHYEGLKERLAEQGRCAQNPTNPVPQPLETRETILREIDEAAEWITALAAQRFLGAAVSQAAGLAPTWLAFVAGPVTSWVDADLRVLSEDRVAEIERLVPRCVGSGATPPPGSWTGTVTWEGTLESTRHGGPECKLVNLCYAWREEGSETRTYSATAQLRQIETGVPYQEELGYVYVVLEGTATFTASESRVFESLVDRDFPECGRAVLKSTESESGSVTGAFDVVFNLTLYPRSYVLQPAQTGPEPRIPTITSWTATVTPGEGDCAGQSTSGSRTGELPSVVADPFPGLANREWALDSAASTLITGEIRAGTPDGTSTAHVTWNFTRSP